MAKLASNGARGLGDCEFVPFYSIVLQIMIAFRAVRGGRGRGEAAGANAPRENLTY